MEWQNGIDTCAHRGTLEVKGKTIAVLGSGFNHVFPPENIELYKEIIEKGGAIVSEYPPETPQSSQNFLNRNRIVSGVSNGILVIEAKHRSGTSVTAKLAKEQNKKIFVIPHEIWDINGVGTNRLLQEGATLVISTEDIINNLGTLQYKSIKPIKIKGNIQILENGKDKISDKNATNKKINSKINRKTIEEKNGNTYSQIINENIFITHPNIAFIIGGSYGIHEEIKNGDYKEIYKIIGNKTCGINEIIRKTNKTIGEINQTLLLMEIEGYIQKTEGGYKCI